MKEIKQLLQITESLREQYGRQFTLDGKLVGDIGEVLVAEKYGLELEPENTPIHDAKEVSTGRKVQIKATMKSSLGFPCDESKIPDYYLGVKINEDGTLTEIFNGKGVSIAKGINRNPTSNGLHSIAINSLKKLMEQVPEQDKISKKKNINCDKT